MISVKKDFDDIPDGLKKKKPRLDESVRTKLSEIYYGKCAYSEEKLTPVSDSNIGCYRPVSLYHWLANEWSNIFLICPECNASAGNRFPITGTQITAPPGDRMQWRADFRTMLEEKPLLLNPEIDTPENHLYFDPKGIIYGRTDRGRETIKVFNLNRDVLISKRKKKVETFLSKFQEILNNFAKSDWEKGNHYRDDKLIYDILFKKIFVELKQAGNPQSEFSLLGRNMLEYFDSFILDHFHWDKAKSTSDESLFSKYYQVLSNALNLFRKTDDIIVCNKIEKEVPFFPKDGAVDERMEKGLPFAVKAFEIQKYHGIKYTHVENLPINARWIFLTGDNSSGKTLVLQALVVGLTGKKDKNVELVDDNCLIKIELKTKAENTINIIPSSLRKRIDNFAAYGPGRLNIDGDIFEGRQAPEKMRKTDSIFQYASSLYNIQEYLVNIHGRKEFEKKFDAIIKSLKQLLPWVEDIIIDESSEKKKILYRERTEDGQVLGEVPFGALSAGSKSIIAMIGDMLIELLQNQDVDDPAELEGIVIIDEIDIHLHAKWQREFVVRLTRMFPKIQFIASTHSPIPLLGAPPETIILNVEKETKQEGIVVKRLPIDVTELTPNTILTSPIFNFDWIIPVAHDRTKPLYTQDNYREVFNEKRLDEKLETLAGKKGTTLAGLMKRGQR
jgi:predicted ATPase